MCIISENKPLSSFDGKPLRFPCNLKRLQGTVLNGKEKKNILKTLDKSLGFSEIQIQI